jgi:hypothetical protein
MSAVTCLPPAEGDDEEEHEEAVLLASLPPRLRNVAARTPLTRDTLPARTGCGDDPELGPLAQAVWDAEKDSARALAGRYRALAALFDREGSADHGDGHVDDDIDTLRAAAALRITRGAARWELRTAHRAVDQLPRTLSLLEQGSFPSTWFTRILRTAEDLSDASRRLLDVVVATWSPAIPGDRFITLLNLLVDLLARREEETEPPPPPPRKVTLAPGSRAGTGSIGIDGPIPEILSYWKRLDESARAIQAAQRKALREGTEIPCDIDGIAAAAGKPVPLDRLRYALQLGATFATDGVQVPKERFRINVTTPVMTLLGASDAPGMLEGTIPIPPEMARALAAGEDTWYRILVDDCRGTFLPLPADRYSPTPAMLQHLRLRNGTCAVPGCTRPASWASEADHIEEFDHAHPERGGRTELENIHLLCWQHHQDKTAGLLDPTRIPTPADEPGRTRWTIGRDGDQVTVTDDTDLATQLTVRHLEKSWERHLRGRRMATPLPEPSEPVLDVPSAPPDVPDGDPPVTPPSSPPTDPWVGMEIDPPTTPADGPTASPPDPRPWPPRTEIPPGPWDPDDPPPF